MSLASLSQEGLSMRVAGLCSFPFERVRRPLYPLDEFEDWRPVTASSER